MTTISYLSIADDLRAAIYRGDYAPGTSLRNQYDLARDYNVNLGTVRRAVNLLAAEGLVDPQRGKGSIVRDRNPIRLPITRYVDATAGAGPWEIACRQQGFTGTTDVLDVTEVPADRTIATHLGIPDGTDVIRRRNRMRIGDRALQLQETWLPRWLADTNPALLETARVGPGGIYGGLSLAGHEPVDAMETVISRMPTIDERTALKLRLGSPVLDIRRTTKNGDGQIVAHTHIVVDAGSVALVYQQALPPQANAA